MAVHERQEIAHVIAGDLFFDARRIVLGHADRLAEGGELVDHLVKRVDRRQRIAHMALHADAVQRRVRIHEVADELLVIAARGRGRAVGADDAVVVDEKPRLGICLPRPFEPLRIDFFSGWITGRSGEDVAEVGHVRRFVDHVPLADHALQSRVAGDLGDVILNSIADVGGIRLVRFEVVGEPIPARPDEVVPADVHTARDEPRDGDDLVFLRERPVAFPLRPLEGIFEDGDVEGPSITGEIG